MNIRKIVCCVIFSLLVLSPVMVLADTMKAVTFEEIVFKEEVINLNKEWTVRFSREIASSSINEENISLQERENETKIPVELKLQPDAKSVRVKPLEQYEPGKSYCLIITDGIQDKKTKYSLANPTYMYFEVKNSKAPVITLHITNETVEGTEESALFNITGSVDREAKIKVNGINVLLRNKEFNINVTLYPGVNTFFVEAEDGDGNKATKIFTIRYDKKTSTSKTNDKKPDETPLILQVNQADQVVTGNVYYLSFLISGSVNKESTVELNGEKVTTVDNTFTVYTELTEGLNTITVQAQDLVGNIVKKTLQITYERYDDNQSPAQSSPPRITLDQSDEIIQAITATYEYLVSGSIDKDSVVTVNGNTVNMENNKFSTNVILSEGENRITIEARDDKDQISSKVLTVNLQKVQIDADLVEVRECMNSVIAEVQTEETKQLSRYIQNVLEQMINDPDYDYESQSPVVKGMYSSLSSAEKDDFQKAILKYIRVSLILKLKSIFGI